MQFYVDTKLISVEMLFGLYLVTWPLVILSQLKPFYRICAFLFIDVGPAD